MAVATEREYLLFINGEAAEPTDGELRDLTEPATGEALGKVALAGEQDVDRAVEAARAALDGDWGRTPPTERSRLLHALADAMVANRKELAELERSRRSPAAPTRSAAPSSSTRSRSRSASPDRSSPGTTR